MGGWVGGCGVCVYVYMCIHVCVIVLLCYYYYLYTPICLFVSNQLCLVRLSLTRFTAETLSSYVDNIKLHKKIFPASMRKEMGKNPGKFNQKWSGKQGV